MFSTIKKLLFHKYITKGVFAICDQGLFSFTTLAVNVLFVRWLSPSEYGSFVIAYSIYIMLQSINMGFLHEPMAIFGTHKYKNNLLKYLNSVIFCQIILSSVFLIIIVLLSLLILESNQSLKYAFLGMGISIPCLFLFNLLRKFYYIKLDSRKACTSSTAYCIGVLLSLYILQSEGLLSPFTAFLTLGAISLVVGMTTFILFYPSWKFTVCKKDIQELAGEHFKYGKWVIGTNLITWIPTNIYVIVLPVFIGIAGTGVFRALLNFALPVQHLSKAFNLLFLPKFSKFFAEKQLKRLENMVSVYTMSVLVVTIIYWLFLSIFGKILISLVYNGKHLEYANLLWLIGLIPFLSTISLPRAYALRAMRKPNKIFISSCITAVFALIGLVLIDFWGLKGAIISLLISTLVNSLCIFYWYHKLMVQYRSTSIHSTQIEGKL